MNNYHDNRYSQPASPMAQPTQPQFQMSPAPAPVPQVHQQAAVQPIVQQQAPPPVSVRNHYRSKATGTKKMPKNSIMNGKSMFSNAPKGSIMDGKSKLK